MVVRAGSQPTESRDDGQDCRHAVCFMRDDDIMTMVQGLLTRWLWRVHSADCHERTTSGHLLCIPDTRNKPPMTLSY
jgi:hypothetical protein